MSPVKRAASEAAEKWAKGIKTAKTKGMFVKGVTGAAERWQDGVTKAGDVTWQSGVEKAASKKLYSKGVQGKGGEWEKEALAAADDWYNNTLAKSDEFAGAITKVIDAVSGCLEGIGPTQIKGAMDELNKSLPDERKLTAKQVKAILFQNCMAKQKGDLKASAKA